jgi:hypothetical protein
LTDICSSSSCFRSFNRTSPARSFSLLPLPSLSYHASSASPGSHADDATDAHAHNHHIDPPLSVPIESLETPHHIHPSHSHHAHSHSHEFDINTVDSPTVPGGVEKRFKDVEASSEGGETVDSVPSTAEASAQLVAVAVLEFGVIFHRSVVTRIVRRMWLMRG